MNSRWQRINHKWIIPPLSALTRFRRKLTRPLLRELNQPRLKQPTNMHFEQHLRHWRFMGGPPRYESGVDTTGFQERPSAFLRSMAAEPEALATLRQTIKADDYRGKQLRFSGDVKVERVEQQAGLWVEAIVQSLPHRRSERLKPENVVRGTHGWMRYEETISIPEDDLFIRFGIALHGNGQLWLANAQLEAIEQDVLSV